MKSTDRRRKRRAPAFRYGSESLEVRTLLAADFGDAPSGYPVRLADDGARHETPAVITQVWQRLGDDIDGEAPEDRSGNSVSLSADGNTVAIGAIGNDDNGTNNGHTRIYRWDSGTSAWGQLGGDIDGEVLGHWSGCSVSLSADGNTVAIGAILNDGNDSTNTNRGHTRIYRWNSGTSTWDQLGGAGTGDIDGEAAGDHSGGSVSLSADGNTVAIGARQNDGNGTASGHTRIYRFDGTAWQQLGGAGTGDIDGEAENNYAGHSVSLSADGNTVAIGAFFNDGDDSTDTKRGHTRIYRYDGAAWQQLGGAGTGDINGEAPGDSSGDSVSLSADGNTVAIGAPGNDGDDSTDTKRGHTRIYRYDGAAWAQLGGAETGDIDGESPGDASGVSVSLSSDGNTVAIGAPVNDDNESTDTQRGHTRIYRYNGTAWAQLGGAETGDIDGESPGDASGVSVSLSSDGNTVAIGAPVNDDNGSRSGHTRIYRLITNPLRLGASRDTEPTGVPSTAADGDGDDEDGLSWPAVLVAGDTYQISVDVRGGSGSGNLDAWIDWNQNGTWNDPGEKIFASTPVTAGLNTLPFTLPVTTTGGDTYARFRLSTAGGLAPTGLAADGEVEDYRVTINAAPTLDAITDLTITEDAGLQNIDLTGITAGPGDSQNLHVTVSSSNPLVTPSPALTYASAETTGSLQFTPLADQFGTSSVTVTVTDAGADGDLLQTVDNASFSRTFTVTVIPVNDLPTLDAFADQSEEENSGVHTVSLTGITAGPSNETETVRLTATSTDASLITDPQVTYNTGEDTATLSWSSEPHQIGTTTITVTVEDAGPDDDFNTPGDNQSLVRTFDITVTARAYDYGDVSQSYPVARIQNGARHDTPASVPQLWVQRGGDIDGEAAGDLSGKSVSLSADGNTVAIGTEYNDGDDSTNTKRGHTQIYRYNGTAWVQLGNDIDGEVEYDQSGYSVSLSADGNTVAIGAPSNDGNGTASGHTRIYRWNSGTSTWDQLGGAGTGDIDGEAAGDWSGWSVSLSADGNTVAIGARHNDGDASFGHTQRGHTRIYRYDGTAWRQLGGAGTGDIDGEAAGDLSGKSVSLSADGNTVAIGAHYNDGDDSTDTRRGHTRIYRFDGTAWAQLGGAGTGDIDGEAAGDFSGHSVSLSADGNTVAIGANFNDGDESTDTKRGHTRIYRYNGTAWAQLGGAGTGDINGEAVGDFSGRSVSLSADGNTVAIGANFNDGDESTDTKRGHTRIYRYNGTAWVQLGGAGTGDIDGEATSDESGWAVSLSADGNTVAIGAHYNDGVNGQDSGHTRIYHLVDDPLRLGATRDVEPTGVPSIAADGDGDDEDGLSWPAVLVAGDTYQIPVDLQGGSGSGNLDAWIDWNQNGHWNDPGEQIVDTQSVTAGVTTVSLTVPGDAASGDTYTRFRLSTAGGLAPTGLAADGEVEDYRVTINAAPTLDPITDLTIAEDAGLQNIDLTGITAGPGETQTLHVTAISSNPGLIPNPTVTYTSAEATGSITFTPLTDASGSATVTVTVTDAGPDGDLSLTADNASFSRTFNVTVTPVNDLPTLDAIADLAVFPGATDIAVSLSGISASGSETQPLRVTASSSNTALVLIPSVIYSPNGATGTLEVTTVSGVVGQAVITVTVEDGGLDDDLSTDGDNATVSRTFEVTVSLSTPEWETQGITSTIDPRQPIRWNPVPGATGYQVWYTNASTGVSPFLTATTDQTEFVPTDGLPIGRFNIWVRAQQDHLNSSWSPGTRLRVWPWTTLQTPDFQQTDLRPTMTWDALNGAVSYRIVYSNLTTGGSRLVDSTVTGTSFTPTEDLSLGHYRAWVAGLDFSGTQTQWSYPVQFTIGPQPISPVLPVFTRRPVLEWTSVPGTATYELYISTQGGNVLTPSGITGTSWTPSSDLATGWLNWWVIGLTDTGARGRWSERASSNTQGRTSVIAPAGSGHSGTPLYQWQAVQDAATYVLIVERVSDRQVLIRENTLTTTTYTPSAALAADTYRVWVQAISTTGQPGWWSRPVEFTVASVTRTKGTADLQPLEPAVAVPDLLNLLADERVSGRTAETASSEVNPQQPTSHPAERRFRQQVVTGTRAARASAAVDNGRSVTDGFANDGPASRTARLPHTSVASEFQQDVHTRDQLMAGLAATKTRPDSFLDVSY